MTPSPIPSGIMTAKVIGDAGVSVTPSGFRLDIRLPWYRSLPVSTVEVAALSIDGAAVDLSTVTFELDGREVPLAAMADAVDWVWYVLDSAYLNVRGAAPIKGQAMQVSVTLTLYPPYIRGLKRMTRDHRLLHAA